MLTVAENIVIPVIGEIKEIAEKYNLSFNDHDTLKSVRDQLLKTKQKHRKLREKYDKLKRVARLAIYDCARAEGGAITNLIFDDSSMTWSADLLKETTNENGVLMRRNDCTIYRAVLMKDTELPLKAKIFAHASLENRLAAKVYILQDVYKKSLRTMLIKDGIYDKAIPEKILNKALKVSHWELPHAYKYILNHLN